MLNFIIKYLKNCEGRPSLKNAIMKKFYKGKSEKEYQLAYKKYSIWIKRNYKDLKIYTDMANER